MSGESLCPNGHLVDTEDTQFCPICGSAVSGGGLAGILGQWTTLQIAVAVIGLGALLGGLMVIVAIVFDSGGSSTTPADPSATSGTVAPGSPSPSATPSATFTLAAATSTPAPPTRTATSAPPTATRTPIPPAATRTPAPPTATRPPTSTPTRTPVPTSTNTPIPPNTPTSVPSPTPIPTPTPTTVPLASMSGFVFLDSLGICDGCDFGLSGPGGVFSVTPQLGNASFSVVVPAGTYNVFYTCEFNGTPFTVPVLIPEVVVLAPGPNQQNVTVGFCF